MRGFNADQRPNETVADSPNPLRHLRLFALQFLSHPLRPFVVDPDGQMGDFSVSESLALRLRNPVLAAMRSPAGSSSEVVEGCQRLRCLFLLGSNPSSPLARPTMSLNSGHTTPVVRQ
jgi:hypothetical protein